MQEYMFIYKTQSSGCYPTNHLFIKMKNRIGHKTCDPWGTRITLELDLRLGNLKLLVECAQRAMS